MLRTLIFDWDGTLHNTLALYGRAFRKAYDWLTEEGYAPKRHYADEEISHYLGMSAPVMCNTFMPELPQNVKDTASALIGHSMVGEVEAGKAILYPGAVETLEALKEAGYTLVFLSNCKRPYLEAHRRAFELDRWFSGFYCCEDYGFAPKTEIFPHIAQHFPGDYCVIGDRASDIEVAQVHHLHSIGCAYGYGRRGELDGAEVVVDGVGDLAKIVAQIQREHGR
jgi:phosphoglycolate phosphatase